MGTTVSSAGTSLSEVRFRILSSSKEMVDRLNNDLIYKYHSAYADYVANMRSGQDVPADRRVPPKPPNAWELAPPTEGGLVFYQIGTTPVCDPGPAVTANFDNPQPNKVPNIIHMGAQMGTTKWYTALPGDTFPSGMQTPPQEDGHVYEKFGAPVGPGWYLQIT